MQGGAGRAPVGATRAPQDLRRRLEAAIAATAEGPERDCLRADHAALLARLGHREAARSEIAALRGAASAQPHPRLTAWLHLAEGLADYFDDLEPTARGKIHQAYTASLPARDPALHALAAAWLAHLDYVRQDVVSLPRFLGQALDLAGLDHHAARGRACLVAAQAWHCAGRFDLALPWYQQARLHATQLGDEATLSALMHNMAWLRAHAVREEALFGAADASQLRAALMSAESTEHFDLGVGTGAMHTLLPVLRAQILTLMGQPAAAQEIFAQSLAQSLTEGLGALEPALRADHAWCLGQLGRLDEAAAAADAALASLGGDCTADDQACALARVAQIRLQQGRDAEAQALQAEARLHLARHHDHQARLGAALQQALRGHTPGGPSRARS